MAKAEAELLVNVSRDDAFRLAHEVLLSMDAKIQTSTAAGGLLIANTGVNWRTFGDRITVQIAESAGGNGCRVSVSSESSALVDWGKGRDNVDVFVRRLQERAVAYTPRPAPAPQRPAAEVKAEVKAKAKVSRRVFVCYRRSDSIDVSGRIYDRMVQEFGHPNVFKDVDNIPFGIDFVTYLDTAVKNCDVLLAIIGPRWLTAVDDRDNRRLDDPADFVRIEIESALRRDILVVPLLVGGATMPGADLLPESLKPLTRRNGTAIRPDPDFHNDITRLIANLG